MPFTLQALRRTAGVRTSEGPESLARHAAVMDLVMFLGLVCVALAVSLILVSVLLIRIRRKLKTTVSQAELDARLARYGG